MKRLTDRMTRWLGRGHSLGTVAAMAILLSLMPGCRGCNDNGGGGGDGKPVLGSSTVGGTQGIDGTWEANIPHSQIKGPFAYHVAGKSFEHTYLEYEFDYHGDIDRQQQGGDKELFREDGPHIVWAKKKKGTYTLAGDKIELTTQDGVKVLPFSHTENTIIIDGVVFARKK